MILDRGIWLVSWGCFWRQVRVGIDARTDLEQSDLLGLDLIELGCQLPSYSLPVILKLLASLLTKVCERLCLCTCDVCLHVYTYACLCVSVHVYICFSMCV